MINKDRDNMSSEVDVGGTQGVRRTTGVTPIGPHIAPPDPEVAEKKRRRKFTARYKLKVLEAADSCTHPGQLGALLRREGLYWSNLTLWNKQREEGLLHGLREKKRGRKAKAKSPLAGRVAELEKENRRLHHKLKQAETIIEVQKKISQLLGIPLDSPESDGGS